MPSKFLNDILDVPQRPARPRKTGLTMVIAPALPDGPPPAMRVWGEYVDCVKFTVQCLWVDDEVMVRNVQGYRALGMDVQIGGVPYEVAMLQGKQRQYLDKMKAIGVNVIEVESHAAGFSVEEMKEEVARLKGEGFRIVGEVGAKWVELDDTREVQDRVNVSKVISKMQQLLEAGADHVYWEGMVVRELIGNQLENKAGQKQLIEVVRTVGLDKVLLEVWDARRGGNSQLWGWLVHQFGPEVCISNVKPDEIGMLESVRRGCIYDPAHPYLRWLSRGKPTTHWWQIEMPDYRVDIQRPPVWRRED